MELLREILRIALKYPSITLNSLAPIFVLVIGIIRYKYLNFSLKLILVFLLFVILTDIPVWITAALKINNLYYVYIVKSISDIIICSVYYFHIKSPSKKKIIFLSIGLMSFLAIFQILFLNDIGEFAFTLKIPLILVVFLHFQTILSELKIKNLLYYPYFWISSGIMLICCFSIMVLLFYNYTIYYGMEDKNQYWFYISFLEFVSIIFYLFMFIGFWVSNKKYT